MLEKALENNDPMAAQLDMPRCKAVLRFWTRDVQAIFTSYAAADMDVDAQAAARLYAALCGTACTHILYLLEYGTAPTPSASSLAVLARRACSSPCTCTAGSRRHG